MALGVGSLSRGSEGEPALADVHIDPAEVTLDGPHSRFTLLVEGRTSTGEIVDLTHVATYESANPEIIAVSLRGIVTSVADGAGTVRVRVAGRELTVPVRVSNSHAERRLNFEHDIIPILSKAGCNTSGCHGKAEGQNGFKLSVFGSDPPADYVALTQEGRGRRVFAARPTQSLLLAKASGGIPHGGGVRIPRDSRDYETLLEWIAGGLPLGQPTDPHVVSVEVTPRERPLRFGARQQLRVIATDSTGRKFDVTEHSRFQSNNDGLARVDESGLVTVGESPGEAAIMASYMGPVAVFRVLIPQPDIAGTYPELPAD
ncbi:MAG TPA: Ig-like domain-containing protein, partial [Planctomycetaceae bacterium]|nr:Ig-like domain-containing protein [Planctomycetaceae bacterium]